MYPVSASPPLQGIRGRLRSFDETVSLSSFDGTTTQIADDALSISQQSPNESQLAIKLTSANNNRASDRPSSAVRVRSSPTLAPLGSNGGSSMQQAPLVPLALQPLSPPQLGKPKLSISNSPSSPLPPPSPNMSPHASSANGLVPSPLSIRAPSLPLRPVLSLHPHLISNNSTNSSNSGSTTSSANIPPELLRANSHSPKSHALSLTDSNASNVSGLQPLQTLQIAASGSVDSPSQTVRQGVDSPSGEKSEKFSRRPSHSQMASSHLSPTHAYANSINSGLHSTSSVYSSSSSGGGLLGFNISGLNLSRPSSGMFPFHPHMTTQTPTPLGTPLPRSRNMSISEPQGTNLLAQPNSSSGAGDFLSPGQASARSQAAVVSPTSARLAPLSPQSTNAPGMNDGSQSTDYQLQLPNGHNSLTATPRFTAINSPPTPFAANSLTSTPRVQPIPAMGFPTASNTFALATVARNSDKNADFAATVANTTTTAGAASLAPSPTSPTIPMHSLPLETLGVDLKRSQLTKSPSSQLLRNSVPLSASPNSGTHTPTPHNAAILEPLPDTIVHRKSVSLVPIESSSLSGGNAAPTVARAGSIGMLNSSGSRATFGASLTSPIKVDPLASTNSSNRSSRRSSGGVAMNLTQGSNGYPVSSPSHTTHPQTAGHTTHSSMVSDLGFSLTSAGTHISQPSNSSILSLSSAANILGTSGVAAGDDLPSHIDTSSTLDLTRILSLSSLSKKQLSGASTGAHSPLPGSESPLPLSAAGAAAAISNLLNPLSVVGHASRSPSSLSRASPLPPLTTGPLASRTASRGDSADTRSYRSVHQSPDMSPPAPTDAVLTNHSTSFVNASAIPLAAQSQLQAQKQQTQAALVAVATVPAPVAALSVAVDHAPASTLSQISTADVVARALNKRRSSSIENEEDANASNSPTTSAASSIGATPVLSRWHTKHVLASAALDVDELTFDDSDEDDDSKPAAASTAQPANKFSMPQRSSEEDIPSTTTASSSPRTRRPLIQSSNNGPSITRTNSLSSGGKSALSSNRVAASATKRLSKRESNPGPSVTFADSTETPAISSPTSGSLSSRRRARNNANEAGKEDTGSSVTSPTNAASSTVSPATRNKPRLQYILARQNSGPSGQVSFAPSPPQSPSGAVSFTTPKRPTLGAGAESPTASSTSPPSWGTDHVSTTASAAGVPHMNSSRRRPTKPTGSSPPMAAQPQPQPQPSRRQAAEGLKVPMQRSGVVVGEDASTFALSPSPRPNPSFASHHSSTIVTGSGAVLSRNVAHGRSLEPEPTKSPISESTSSQRGKSLRVLGITERDIMLERAMQMPSVTKNSPALPPTSSSSAALPSFSLSSLSPLATSTISVNPSSSPPSNRTSKPASSSILSSLGLAPSGSPTSSQSSSSFAFPSGTGSSLSSSPPSSVFTTSGGPASPKNSNGSFTGGLPSSRRMGTAMSSAGAGIISGGVQHANAASSNGSDVSNSITSPSNASSTGTTSRLGSNRLSFPSFVKRP